MNQQSKLFNLEGKGAIVTGASRGLGVTFAETLSAAGAQVVLAARNVEKLNDVAKRLTATGATAHVIRCDVTQSEDVRGLAAQAWETLGRVDILVNNAGVAAD